MNLKVDVEEGGIYTGVGSRKTPRHIRVLMTEIAEFLSSKGWALRSGGARGADRAFKKGTIEHKIYPSDSSEYSDDIWHEAISMARKHHPVWNSLSYQSKSYLTRNTFQVLGRDLSSPSNFLICWTPDGATTKEERGVETGGTGQTIAIACTHDVPVYNLQIEEDRNLFEELIKNG